MTEYATSFIGYVRRLSWSNNGANADQPQRPSPQDLLEGSPRSSWSLASLLNAGPHVLHSQLDTVADQSDSDADDAVSEQTVVAVPAVLRRAPMPGAGGPAYIGELARGLRDNSVGDVTMAMLHPPTVSPAESSAQGQNSSLTSETTITTPEPTDGTNDASDNMKPATLPEDDGQATLRHLLQEIHNMEIPEREKAMRMHAIMTEKYNASREKKTLPQKTAKAGKGNPFEVTPEDTARTYCKEGAELGCSHYKRGVKLQCSTCHKWYTCRFCHDQQEDHTLIRSETKNMLCMHCGRAQPAQQDCRHCGVKSAKYYCDKCKLWDDDNMKNIYHCDDCGICRIGVGLGKDFFHCKKCGVCMSIALQEFHRCIERSTECDCPICGEYMFTSTSTVVFMPCGHSIHHGCYYEHMKRSYRCPTCARTIANMESHFRQLDIEIAHQPLPAPYDAWRCMISCNDCSAKSNVPFHFLGLKCETCKSYNTSQVKLIRPEDSSLNPQSSASFQSGQGDRPVSPAPSGLRDPTGTETLMAANAAIMSADAAINTVSEGRLVYDDGWDSDQQESGDNWSRCGSDRNPTSDNEEELEDEPADGLVEEDDDEDEEDEFLNLTGHR